MSRIIDYNPANNNGGFETGALSGWTTYVVATSTVAISSAQAHSGTYSIACYTDASNHPTELISPSVLTPGVLYVAWFWAIQTTGTLGNIQAGDLDNDIYINFGALSQAQGAPLDAFLTNSWALYGGTFTPIGTYFEIKRGNITNANWYIDDIRVDKANVIQNVILF